MKLLYYLPNNAGYEEVKILHGDFCKIYYVDEWMGDRLEALLGGIIGLTGCYNETKIGRDIDTKYLEKYDDGTFEWHADIGSVKSKFTFMVTDTKEKLLFKVFEYEYTENKDENGKDIWDEHCVFENTISLISLIDDLIFSCEQMLSKYGLIGYYENCWNEFPVYHFLLLKNYRQQKICFQYFDEDIDHKSVSMTKTNLSTELEFLLNAK